MITPLTPLEFARRTRALYPDREALVDGALRLTCAQFFDRCDRWSAALQAFGVARGDRVAYIAPNTHAQLESFYAVPQIGAVLVPMNYRLSAGEFEYIINHSGATVVCAHADYLECLDLIRARLPGVKHFVALEGSGPGWLDYEQLLAAAPTTFDRADVGEQELLTINHTSGTTSRPKGVMITHRNAYINVVGTLLHIPMQMTDRYLWTLPMFHANGWTYVWTVTAVGGAHVCLRKVDPAHIFPLVAAERVSIFCAAPTVLIGVASAPQELRASVPQGLPVGEIVVRGNAVMQGYYNDPDATAAALRGGYFHSGDAAVVHPDGYVDIRDRLKDVIISGGENISSVEVEGVLLRHPAVHEAAVVGLPDARWGEAPHAFVVLKPGASCAAEELRAHTRERLAHFKCPHSFTFVGERSEEHTSELQSRFDLVCRLLLEKKKKKIIISLSFRT